MPSDERTRIISEGRADVGTQLSGIYELDERIALGGMGEVYRGHNIQTGDPVAIKIVLPEFASDETILLLFKKEASILNHLSHDAIVRYHVFSIDQKIRRPYLAMEFVNGESLLDVMRHRPMPPGDIRKLCFRLASGLAAAHEAGIIHRDLSPDNVILPGGKVERAKIIDFGIARSAIVGGKTLLEGKFAGKYNYVSPEQLGLYGGEVSERSDIYSLGLVLAAAARGDPLDMGGTQVEIIEKRRTVPDLVAIDADLRPLIEAMLQPDPSNRPSGMAEIAAWLSQQDATVSTQPGTHPFAAGTGVIPAKTVAELTSGAADGSANSRATSGLQTIISQPTESGNASKPPISESPFGPYVPPPEPPFGSKTDAPAEDEKPPVGPGNRNRVRLTVLVVASVVLVAATGAYYADLFKWALPPDLPVAQESPQVAQEQPPVAQKPPPVVQEPPPVAQEPSPVAQEPPPVAQEPPPVAQEPLPVAQEKLPAVQEKLPAVQAPPPVGSESPQAAQKAPPAVKEPPSVIPEPPRASPEPPIEQKQHAGDTAAPPPAQQTATEHENAPSAQGPRQEPIEPRPREEHAQDNAEAMPQELQGQQQAALTPDEPDTTQKEPDREAELQPAPEITPVPLPPAMDSKAPEDDSQQVATIPAAAVNEVAAKVSWVRDYAGDGCFFATATSASDKAVEIEGFGQSVEPFTALLKDFENTFQIEPNIGARLIVPEQCVVTKFLRELRNSSASAPALSLAQTVIPNGGEVRGLVGKLNGRKADLILIDHKGMAYNLNRHLKVSGDTATFNINVGLSASDLAKGKTAPQVVVAVVSSNGIKAADFSQPILATEVLPRVLDEIEGGDTESMAVAKYFRLGG